MSKRVRPKRTPDRGERGRRPSRPPQGKKPPIRESGGLQLNPNQRYVIGLHAAREALRVRPGQVSLMQLRSGWEDSEDLKALAELASQHRIPQKSRKVQALDQIAASHQGVALVVDEAPAWSDDLLEKEERIILLALDQITDPHNLGAILRTSWLMGVSGVLVPKHRSASLSPAATKVASGAAEHVPVRMVDNLPNEIAALKEKGFWIYGLAAEGRQNLWQCQFPERVLWVIGAEDRGLRTSTVRVCDELISIFQVDSAASYNASVAAAMALAETRRQHQSP